MTTAPPDPHSEAVLSRPAPPADDTRSYGADPAQQVYDVRLPHPAQSSGPAGHTPTESSGPAVHRGTVLIVHGGFWRATYDRAHVAAQAHALTQEGFHVAVGEYRRAGMPGGGVPGTLEDVTALIVAVAHDEQLPGPLVLMGHSAGGHLVAWAANQDLAQHLAGVVALGGCIDLAATERLGLGDGAARNFVGGPPEQLPEAWAMADPMTSLPPRVPVRLVHGALDHTVPVETNEAYLARCRVLEADVTLDVMPGAGHFSLIDPEDPAWQNTLAALDGLSRGALPLG